MTARFRGRGGPGHPRRTEPISDTGFGEWWAAIAVLALVAVGIVSLADRSGGASAPAFHDPSPELLASTSTAERSVAAVEEALRALCREPVLLALELEPDCESGIITLQDALFDDFGSATLLPEAREDLTAAIQIYLARLRNLPEIWNRLEAIEIRGHTDPRAIRAPYATNLVGSQQRPLGVLLFLVGPDGLSIRDRVDLERLAVVSGASFSRPPAACPDETRECFEQWRRVEIRPVLSESLRRRDWSRTLQDVRLATQRIQQALQVQER
ncbi:MAG: hypothetical protein CL933_03010 [Deltaproteobacteria bacterium]|nr:hypothetical protein [Deltaproteobacteria bacterium]